MRTVFQNRWIVFLLILPHIGIYHFQAGPLVPLIQVWQLGVLLPFLIPVYLRINTFNVLLVISLFLILVSTLINGNITTGTIFFVITLGGLCYYISNATKDFKELITGLYYLFSIVVVINFMTMLFSPLQVNGYYFLGGKNAISLALLPAIPLIYLYSLSTHKKLKMVPLILILVSILSIFLAGSGTSTVVAILAVIFVFLPKRLSPSLFGYLVLYTVAFFSMVVFRFQDMFANFIINVLNKDLTFTGRTYIWDRVLNGMQGEWLIGLGRESDIVSSYFSPVSATHNGVLQVLVFSGVFGLILFVAILLKISKSLNVYRKNPAAKMLSFSILAYLVIGLTESVFYLFEFWLLLALSFDIERIVNQVEIKDYEENKLKTVA